MLRCLLLLLLLGCRSGRSKSSQPTTVDVVTLGDVWLERSIREGLLQPIADAREYRWWVSEPRHQWPLSLT